MNSSTHAPSQLPLTATVGIHHPQLAPAHERDPAGRFRFVFLGFGQFGSCAARCEHDQREQREPSHDVPRFSGAWPRCLSDDSSERPNRRALGWVKPCDRFGSWTTRRSAAGIAARSTSSPQSKNGGASGRMAAASFCRSAPCALDASSRPTLPRADEYLSFVATKGHASARHTSPERLRLLADGRVEPTHSSPCIGESPRQLPSAFLSG